MISGKFRDEEGLKPPYSQPLAFHQSCVACSYDHPIARFHSSPQDCPHHTTDAILPETLPPPQDLVTRVPIIASSYSTTSTTLEFANEASPCLPKDKKNTTSIATSLFSHFGGTCSPRNFVEYISHSFHSLHNQALGGGSLSYPHSSLEPK